MSVQFTDVKRRWKLRLQQRRPLPMIIISASILITFSVGSLVLSLSLLYFAPHLENHSTTSHFLASYSSSSNYSNDWRTLKLKSKSKLSLLHHTRKQVTAYLEPPFHNKYSQSEVPLPLRTQSPTQLTQVVYPRIQTCHDVPSKLPVDRGIQYDPMTGEPLVTNVGDQVTPPNFVQEQLPYCPVDADPYLPWIHDVFVQGSRVQFVAQNKRRCQTGSKHSADKERLEPQVALMQSVSLQRLPHSEAIQLAPALWNDPNTTTASQYGHRYRYRLAPYHQADPDIQYTRFLCRFHTYSSNGEGRQELGESWSEYPFSYELAAFRKHNNKGGLLSKEDKDNTKFWTATLLFSCPLPLSMPQNANDWTTHDKENVPLFHVDVIPIRTPARFPLSSTDGGFYLSEEQVGSEWAKRLAFDPLQAWGDRHVLPLPEASGRWENLPLCPVSATTETTFDHNVATPSISHQSTKRNLLSACLWAAASFRTRGKENVKHSIDDTLARLQEWIEFHLLVGFDHIYVYDNSGAFGNSTSSSLKPIVQSFPSSQVTWIDWPMQVCNNNIPAHDNTGERSSQYAAENSCRTRYGPTTEWMASFDTDEYLVPQGSHTTLRTVVEQATDTNILSFPSSRGKLRFLYSDANRDSSRSKMTNITFLQAFNCDGSPTPRPNWADRARKQLYRPSYVLNHFVHYSTVTKGLISTYAQIGKQNWSRYFEEEAPSERRIDEIHEAMMIHTKSLDNSQTRHWDQKCRFDFPKKYMGCSIGIPFPDMKGEIVQETYNIETGLEYNCHVNRHTDEYWAPRLEMAMMKRRRILQMEK